jgi:hypothetical protein
MRPRGGDGRRRRAFLADAGSAARRGRAEKMCRRPLRLLVAALLLILAVLCVPRADAIVTPDAPVSSPVPLDDSGASATEKAASAPTSATVSSTAAPIKGSGRAGVKREAEEAKPDPVAAKTMKTDAGPTAAESVPPPEGENDKGSGSAASSAASSLSDTNVESSSAASQGGETAAVAVSSPAATALSTAGPKPQRVTEVYIEQVGV